MARFENHWSKPHTAQWMEGDGQAIRKFNNEHVVIDSGEWQRNCVSVDLLLGCIYEKIGARLKKTQDPCIVIKPFVRQGSSREGTKVYHANEFDAVLPFDFVEGIQTAIIESPNQSLPAGIAKIQLLRGNLKSKFKREDSRGNSFVNSRVLHGEYFEGMVLSAVEEAKPEIRSKISNYRVEVNGRSVNPPAITLEVKITDLQRSGIQQELSVDVVPGYEIRDMSNPSVHRKFLVSRWITMERSKKLHQEYADPDLLWRISSSHFEMCMFEPTRMPSSFPTRKATTLMSSYMIFKALKELDSRKHPSSQFCNVLRSYYMKNAFFYILYFIQKEGIQIHNVSQGVALLVSFVQKSLEIQCLPQFFTDAVAIATYFPEERKTVQPKKENLLIEKNKQSLHQANQDLQKALEKFGLITVVNPYIDECRAKLQPLFERVVTKDN